MSLTQLRTIPATPRGWDEFQFWHYNHHKAIIAAALSVKNVRLTLYDIFPISPDNVQGFLTNHQSLHNDMNSLYGVPGSDLSTVDFQNAKEVVAWTYLNWSEHVGVAQRCGLPI